MSINCRKSYYSRCKTMNEAIKKKRREITNRQTKQDREREREAESERRAVDTKKP